MMSFPNVENSVAKALMSEEQEAVLFRSVKTNIYEELLKGAKQEATQHKGRGRDSSVRRASAEVLVDLLERAKELNFIPVNPDDPNSDYTITGNFVKDETFTWKENSQTTVINIFRAGTEVNIFGGVEEKPPKTTFSGNVGNVTADRTLALVANKYGRLLRQIDKEARKRAAAKPS